MKQAIEKEAIQTKAKLDEKFVLMMKEINVELKALGNKTKSS